MARHVERTFEKVKIVGSTGDVDLESGDDGSGSSILKITCEDAVATEALTVDSSLLIEVNGALYKIPLEAQ